jgi:non-specific protein-tyrosine kinase
MEMELSSVEQNEDSLDLRQYVSLFLHWSWLIILAAVVAGTVAYFLSIRMTPYYQSSTTTLVNEAPATKTTDYSSVMMSEQLATTYSKMMTNDPVLIQVAYQANLAVSLEELKKWITVSPIQNTQLIQITVETVDPDLSAKIANAIAIVFAAQIQDIQSQRFATSKATLEIQLADSQNQITADTLQADSATTPEDKARLDAKLTQDRSIYSNLLLSYEQVQLSEAQAVSSVVQVESAIPNIVPVRPKVLQNTLLAAMVGLLLASGGIVAREALDDTVKTPDGVSHKFKLPILGVINHHAPEQNSPITITAPRSPTAEAYRTLRTNVNFASVDHPLRTLMITSPEPGEGKTTTISNLGVVMAQNGKTVIIADCDLRHPRVHTYFGLSNRMGISTLFGSNLQVTTGTRQPTKVDHLSVVATGALPPNPSELLGSQRMQAILNAMRQTSDVILIDTPPALAVTDAAALAPSIDGVLIVVRPGKTRMSALKQTLEQLKQVNARVLGVVLNDVVTRGKSYGYHYQYYRNYAAYQEYYGSKSKGKKGKLK